MNMGLAYILNHQRRLARINIAGEIVFLMVLDYNCGCTNEMVNLIGGKLRLD